MLLLILPTLFAMPDTCFQQTDMYGLKQGLPGDDVANLRSTLINENTKVQRIVVCGSNGAFDGIQMTLALDYTQTDTATKSMVALG